jgi:ketosteroid isomerase-like protein
LSWVGRAAAIAALEGVGAMDTCDIVAAKLDITEVAAKYGHYCDHKDWDSVLGLFTDDAVFDASKVYDQVWSGKEELREFYYNSPAHVVAHHPTSLFIELDDEGSALARAKMLVVWPRQIFSVDYAWELTRAGGQWLIKRQTIEVVGKARFAEAAVAR